MLESCPFCGGKADLRDTIYHAPELEKKAHVWYVICTDCEVRTMAYWKASTAEKVWNRRVKDVVR